jgi:hypothetical protein
MCVVSSTFDSFDPVLPWPREWTKPVGWPIPPAVVWPWSPVPNTGVELSPDALQKLLDAFHKAVEAAREADKAAGQPDCEDPEKAKIEERVAELEKQLASLKAARPKKRTRKARVS